MSKFSTPISTLFLFCLLTSCVGIIPAPIPTNSVDIVGTSISTTFTALPLPTITITPVPKIVWVRHQIDLYGMTVNLPSNWEIQEINRHSEPTNFGDPITGHDCAEYQISSFDNLAILFLRPTCGFSEGFPGTYPPGTVIINPYSADKKIGRYFNQGEYVYSDVVSYSYSDLAGDHREIVCYEPPVIVLGEGQDFLDIGTTFKYLGPQEQIEKILETADKIVLSIAKQ